MGVWRWPVVIAVVSAVGLGVGLWGDGAWDVAACVALGVPVAVGLWFALVGRSPRRRD